MTTKSVMDEYFHYQDKYTKQYGENAIVLMMIGGFYEMYQTNTKGFDLTKINVNEQANKLFNKGE